MVSTAYLVVRGEECGWNRKVCLQDLRPSRHQGISACCEVVPSFIAIFIGEADHHVALLNQRLSPCVGRACLQQLSGFDNVLDSCALSTVNQLDCSLHR